VVGGGHSDAFLWKSQADVRVGAASDDGPSVFPRQTGGLTPRRSRYKTSELRMWRGAAPKCDMRNE
jgi:hypothetical protein